MFERKKVKEFLLKHKQHESNVDQNSFVKNFIFRMEEGLKKDGELLAMVPCYLFDDLKPLLDSEKILVLDAGGTHFRVAYGQYINGIAKFTDNEKSKIPGLIKPLDKDEFFSEIADKCKNHISNANKIGFCFSYPIKITENLDGEVIRMTKENNIKNIEGCLAGKEILNKFKKIDNKEKKIALFNDTIATLYGGISDIKEKANYVGFILGTGTNIAYFENPKNISKVKINKDNKVSINVESAYFKDFELGDFESDYIKETGINSTLEKCISGVYFSKILKKAFEYANKEGLLSFFIPDNTQLRDFSFFMMKKENVISPLIKTSKEEKISRILINEMIKRNAKLSSSSVAAAFLKNYNKDLPCYLIAEGSTFKGLPDYKKYFDKYLNNFLKDKKLKVTRYSSEDLTKKGSLFIGSNL